MNATISVGITDETGKTDILVNHHDKYRFLPLTKVTMTKTNIYNNITDASFSRISRLLAKRGSKTHETGTMLHYKVR
jgi:hypothetical protein